MFKYYMSDKWALKIDSRAPYYNDPFLGIETSFRDDVDVFISSFYEISYSISDRSWIALGYGVNPISIDPVSDKFYNRGREDYLEMSMNLSSHLSSSYGGLGEKTTRIRELIN